MDILIKKIMYEYGRNDPRRFVFFIESDLNWVRYDDAIKVLAKVIPPSAKVLEVGCGCGHTTAMLAHIRPDLTIIGTDETAAQTWEHFKAYGCSFQCCDATQLPFGDEEFDAVISFGVIEHVGDDVKFLTQIYRCLKYGGYNIIFDLPNKYSFSEFVGRKLKLPCHQKRYAKQVILDLLRNAKFEIVHFKREAFIPAQMNRISPLAGRMMNHMSVFLFYLDRLICKTPFAFVCQNFRIISQKKFVCGKPNV